LLATDVEAATVVIGAVVVPRLPALANAFGPSQRGSTRANSRKCPMWFFFADIEKLDLQDGSLAALSRVDEAVPPAPSPTDQSR
jgi:hypothetical protein